ncbi:uncharacterized protein LOC113366568 [Ctenocephalides felis]|uniref:uncharacterized protein LOC113366568 n=1 Tax=Ctenocephalides felis TaxID=7515 RepID=UPI000E6E468B|nr:uncharacterized protein LOC113366568 [Ctenocephalides felis]
MADIDIVAVAIEVEEAAAAVAMEALVPAPGRVPGLAPATATGDSVHGLAIAPEIDLGIDHATVAVAGDRAPGPGHATVGLAKTSNEGARPGVGLDQSRNPKLIRNRGRDRDLDPGPDPDRGPGRFQDPDRAIGKQQASQQSTLVSRNQRLPLVSQQHQQ